MTDSQFRNSTEIEKFAQSTHMMDFADGHARHSLHPDTLARFGSILNDAFNPDTSNSGCHQEAEQEFLHCLGRRTGEIYAPERTRVLYSASVAIDILGKFFSARASRVGVITPTFDNIPALLRMSCRDIVPIPEERLLPHADTDYLELTGIDTLLVVTPNNPTGHFLDRAELCRLLEWAASRRVTVAFDMSFRMLEPATCVDVLALADAVGAPVATVDDTGKVIPLLDTKVSVLSFTSDLAPLLTEIVSQYLLNVSTLDVLFLTAALDTRSAGRDEVAAARDLARANRDYLRARLSEVHPKKNPFTGKGSSTVPSISMSVEWLHFAELTLPLLAACRARNLELLPGNAFFWESHNTVAESHDWTRVALLREQPLFRKGCDTLLHALADL
ncbi:pyridoxal phosphate-dependent aminotransferase [Streptomyces sp. JNUCC 63]